MRATGMTVVAVGVLAGSIAHVGQADVFLGVSRSGSLLRFDMGAHTVTTVGAVAVGGNSITGIEDCDFDDTGVLYATASTSFGGFPPVTVNQTYRVNTNTGASLAASDLGAVQIHSLAHRSGPEFYTVNFTGGFPFITGGNLISLNASTGAFTSVAGVSHGLPGSFRVDALAISPTSMLYGIWDAGSAFLGTHDYKLVSFSTSNGLGSIIGSIGNGSQAFESLRFDAAGTAYTVDSVTGNVFTVNLTTGQGTFLFAGGAAATGTTGLAYVPTPGVGVAVLGGLAMVAKRRRSRLN